MPAAMCEKYTWKEVSEPFPCSTIIKISSTALKIPCSAVLRVEAFQIDVLSSIEECKIDGIDEDGLVEAVNPKLEVLL